MLNLDGTRARDRRGPLQPLLNSSFQNYSPKCEAEPVSLLLIPQTNPPGCSQALYQGGPALLASPAFSPEHPCLHLAGSSPTAQLPSQASPSPTCSAPSTHTAPSSRTFFPSPGPTWLSKSSPSPLKAMWSTQEAETPPLYSQLLRVSWSIRLHLAGPAIAHFYFTGYKLTPAASALEWGLHLRDAGAPDNPHVLLSYHVTGG